MIEPDSSNLKFEKTEGGKKKNYIMHLIVRAPTGTSPNHVTS